MIALAEALGLPFEIKQLEYNSFCHLGPRLLGRSTVSLTPGSRAAVLDCDPPDLTISAGHRSVPVVRALRHRSEGRLRSIHAGFPRVSPGHFDLVIATPQYALADHPNLLRIPFALTRAATAAADPADRELLAALPEPRRLLVVGGPTLYWRIDEAALLEALDDMLADAARDGGSVLVTTSPRTPSELHGRIGELLAETDVPSLLAAARKLPRYPSLLEAADSIRITADSVSMVSDGIWTGKPLALVPVAKSRLGRVVIAISDRLRPGRPLYPQDLRRFWDELGEIGVSERAGIPCISPGSVIRSVLDRIRPLLSSYEEWKNGGRGKD